MARLNPQTYQQVERKLRAAGFVQITQKGSHVKFIKMIGQNRRVVIVARHFTDIPVGTLRSILNQAGLTLEEFLHL